MSHYFYSSFLFILRWSVTSYVAELKDSRFKCVWRREACFVELESAERFVPPSDSMPFLCCYAEDRVHQAKALSRLSHCDFPQTTLIERPDSFEQVSG